MSNMKARASISFWLILLTLALPDVTGTVEDAQPPQNSTTYIVTQSCGYSKSPRIVGGSAASPGEFPWTISILLRDTHYCGGSLIDKRWILTAAHCVHRNGKNAFKVRIGEYRLDEHAKHEKDISVDNVIVHPNFILARYVNDLALLHLTEDVIWGDNVQPICLPEANNESYVGKEVTVAGWGWLDEPEKGGTRSNVLQKLSMNVVDRKQCQTWYKDAGKHVSINVNQMCAGFKEGGKDSCHGDSGGPLMLKEGSQYHLVGVVSAGIGCARPLLPGLYTNVSAYLSWIKEHTHK